MITYKKIFFNYLILCLLPTQPTAEQIVKKKNKFVLKFIFVSFFRAFIKKKARIIVQLSEIKEIELSFKLFSVKTVNVTTIIYLFFI